MKILHVSISHWDRHVVWVGFFISFLDCRLFNSAVQPPLNMCLCQEVSQNAASVQLFFRAELLTIFLSFQATESPQKKQVLQGSALKPENSPQSFHCLKQMLSPCVAMVLKSVDEALVLLHPLVLNSGAGMETIRLGGMVVGVEFFWVSLD